MCARLLWQLLTASSQLSEQAAQAAKEAADSRHKLDEVVGKMKTLLGKHRELQVCALLTSMQLRALAVANRAPRRAVLC